MVTLRKDTSTVYNKHADKLFYHDTENNEQTQHYEATEVVIPECGTATYDDLNDWLNNTQASGLISGGGFTDNVDGTVDVAAGTGFIRASGASDIEPAFFCDWPLKEDLALADESTNYIYVDYNSGTPEVVATVTKTDANNRDKFLLGKIYREGNVLHMVEAGMTISEATKRVLGRFTQVDGEVVRASGVAIAESGERYLTSTNGVLWAGLTRLVTIGIDTTGADTFETYYYDGDLGTPAWVEGSASQIDFTNYNDVATGLVALTANRYGVFWAYGDPDGHLMVVYGQGDYTLAGAEAANPPASLPGHVTDFGFLAAKIIVQKSATNLYAVEGAYETQFTSVGAVIHNDTISKDGGAGTEYYHMTAAEHTIATQEATAGQSGYATDVQITKLDTVEDSATANPDAIDNLIEDTTPQLGGTLDGDQNKIENFLHTYRDEVGVIYTFVNDDSGKVVTFNNADPITVTIPETLPIGWNVTCVQLGVGQVTFSSDGSMNLRSRESHSTIAGQYGRVTLDVYVANNIVLGGDGAT